MTLVTRLPIRNSLPVPDVDCEFTQRSVQQIHFAMDVFYKCHWYKLALLPASAVTANSPLLLWWPQLPNQSCQPCCPLATTAQGTNFSPTPTPQSHRFQKESLLGTCTLAGMCRYDLAAPGESRNGFKHIHEARLNKAGLQSRSPALGDPPLFGLLLISLDALLLPGFSPRCLRIIFCPHIFHPGILNF